MNSSMTRRSSGVMTAKQALASRETDPLGSAVISVTKMQGADANNVMPGLLSLKPLLLTRRSLQRCTADTAMLMKAVNPSLADVVTLGGTVRALTTPQMMQLKKRMLEV